MLHIFASVGTPASTAVQQATSGSNLHFYVTTAAIGTDAAVMGWFLRRLISQNDERYSGLVGELHDTNQKLDATNERLGAVAENLAGLAGEIRGAEQANVRERRRVQSREKDPSGR